MFLLTYAIGKYFASGIFCQWNILNSPVAVAVVLGAVVLREVHVCARFCDVLVSFLVLQSVLRKRMLVGFV